MFGLKKLWPKIEPVEAGLMLLLAGLGLAAGWWASVILYDDALITFRVAENLAYGRGFVYNPGERVQVTTTPLYALLLAGGTWLFGSARQAALPLNLLLTTLMPVLAYDSGRRLAGRLTGLAGALLLIPAPLLILAFSMESYLYATLILAAFWAYLRQQPGLTGLFVGLTAMVRGDGALLGASLLTYDLIAHRRLRWRLILPAITMPALWYAFAWLYYGDPLPATLGAKVAQGQFDWLGANFLDGLAFYWQEWLVEAGYAAFYLVPLFWSVGLGAALWRERPWLILVGRDVLYVAAFVFLNVPATEWYYAALMPGVALLTGRGIHLTATGLVVGLERLVSVGRSTPSTSAGRSLSRPRHEVVSKGGATGYWVSLPASLAHGLKSGLVAGLVALLVGTAFYPASAAIIATHPDWKATVYPDTARWLAAHTNASANLATIDIGHLGYWSGRPIIDIVGLAQPDVAPFIAQGDFGYAIRHYQPDMILLGFSWLPEVQSAAWFQTTYVPRRYFKFREFGEPLLLFSRPEGVKVQPDFIPTSAIQPLAVDFNRQITLTGYHLNSPLAPGKPLDLTLFWRADAPIQFDFTVFVQVVDSDNNVVAQQDSQPQEGFYATSSWQPGEKIIDSHAFLLPPDLPPGGYDILVGFYEADTGQRLQILDEAGRFQQDHVRLSDVPVRGL